MNSIAHCWKTGFCSNAKIWASRSLWRLLTSWLICVSFAMLTMELTKPVKSGTQWKPWYTPWSPWLPLLKKSRTKDYLGIRGLPLLAGMRLLDRDDKKTHQTRQEKPKELKYPGDHGSTAIFSQHRQARFVARHSVNPRGAWKRKNGLRSTHSSEKLPLQILGKSNWYFDIHKTQNQSSWEWHR